jgi:hypothetical protein
MKEEAFRFVSEYVKRLLLFQSLSILMINMLVSDFFSKQHEEDFIIALESWMLFGLNWTYVMKNLKVVETGKSAFIGSSISLSAYYYHWLRVDKQQTNRHLKITCLQKEKV